MKHLALLTVFLFVVGCSTPLKVVSEGYGAYSVSHNSDCWPKGQALPNRQKSMTAVHENAINFCADKGKNMSVLIYDESRVFTQR